MSEPAGGIGSGYEDTPEGSGTRELFKDVELGLDARHFLDSTLGRYVAGRAQDEMYVVAQSLATVDPFDRRAIIGLQNRHAIAAAALSWLGQAVEAGIQAEHTLQAMENAD